jgi:hypothetical protein
MYRPSIHHLSTFLQEAGCTLKHTDRRSLTICETAQKAPQRSHLTHANPSLCQLRCAQVIPALQSHWQLGKLPRQGRVVHLHRRRHRNSNIAAAVALCPGRVQHLGRAICLGAPRGPRATATSRALPGAWQHLLMMA